jgi:uncharacterized caspase-like protein
LAVLSAAAEQPYAQPQKFALVIGISGYEPFGPDAAIRYADRDASDFAAFIKTAQGDSFPAGNVHLVTNKAASRRRIFSELRWLQSAGSNDKVYVFFAGHGIEFDNETYLLPADATRDTIDSTGIPMRDFFYRVTSKLSAMQIVVFIDACHAAAAAEGARDSPSVNVQKEWAGIDVRQGQVAMALFSSLANQRSWEDSLLGGGHGLFTWYLLRGLKGDAGSSPDGWITAGDVLDYTKKEVESRSLQMFRVRQTPFGSSRFRPDLPLARTAGKRLALAHTCASGTSTCLQRGVASFISTTWIKVKLTTTKGRSSRIKQ